MTFREMQVISMIYKNTTKYRGVVSDERIERVESVVLGTV
jgi:hypothetical protein